VDNAQVVADLAPKGYSDHYIASLLGIGAKHVGELRRRAGIPSGRAWRAEARNQQVLALAASGATDHEIADELGVGIAWARQIRTQVGISHARRFADHNRVEEMLADGCSLTEIGRTLGWSTATMVKYFRGRGWTAEQSGAFARACHAGDSA
jgi:hypothetical protein